MAAENKKLSKRGRVGEGKPPLYDDPAKLQAAVDSYFAERDKAAKDTKVRPHYTICGLALALGFTSRQSLLNYEDKPEFVDIIKKAKLRVEQNYEECLRDHACVGSIFALKNMKWKDGQTVEHELSGKLIVESINRYGEKVEKAESEPSEQKTDSQEPV